MWFSPDRRERPDRARRRPSHATVVAYLALIVAVVGSTGAAVAAGLIHTRNIADGAVTNPKIRNNAVGTHKIRENAIGPARLMNGAVTNPKLRNDSVGAVKIRTEGVHRRNIRDHSVNSAKIQDGGVRRPDIANGAINGEKVANNSLTGRNIDESTLHVTRVAHRLTHNQRIEAFHNGHGFSLHPSDYVQPAGTSELYLGTFRVHIPAGCTLRNGQRGVHLVLWRNPFPFQGHSVTTVAQGDVIDHGTGAVTDAGKIFGEGDFATTAAHHWELFGAVFGQCGHPIDEPHPQVESVTVDVLHIR